MLDIKALRDNPDHFKAALAKKGVDSADIDRLLTLDEERRSLATISDNLKKERNEKSRSIGKIVKQGGDAEEAKAKVRQIGEEIASIDAKAKEIEADLHDRLLRTPNVPHEAAPEGGEEANKVIREWGEKPEFDFAPRDYQTLGEGLGMFDFEAAARVSGHGFSVLVGKGAALERGLVSYMLHLQTERNGYTEVLPPYLVTRETMMGTGQLPKHGEDLYWTSHETDNLLLIPTAEVPVTNLNAGQILSGADLPKKYAAFSPCFRREAGAHGKDTSGLQRMHQFHKVELVKLCAPEDSPAEHEALLADAESVLRDLGLHYRVLELATKDMSSSAHRCFDIEVWAPGLDRYLEVSSCSNFLDYQARRANIRYRPEESAKPEHVHTLNGSGVALPRLMIALLENYQKIDGSVELPEILERWTGFWKIAND